MINCISKTHSTLFGYQAMAESHAIQFSIKQDMENQAYKAVIDTDLAQLEIVITTKYSLLKKAGTAQIEICSVTEDGWQHFKLLYLNSVASQSDLARAVLFELNEALISINAINEEDLIVMEFEESGATRSISYL